eukprot:gene41951-56809_t
MAKLSTGTEQALLMGSIDRLRSSGFDKDDSSLVYLPEGWKKTSHREVTLRNVINSE